jgi:hypothetical protein
LFNPVGAVIEAIIETCGESSVLALVTKRFNSQKGGGGYHFLDVPWVGPNFRHHYAQNNAPDALMIDGDSFVDATGKPRA